MLCWLGAQSLCLHGGPPCACRCMCLWLCVWQNWMMMFFHHNQAHLQTLKSNTLKCQHSKLQIWICSIIYLARLCCLYFDRIDHISCYSQHQAGITAGCQHRSWIGRWGGARYVNMALCLKPNTSLYWSSPTVVFHIIALSQPPLQCLTVNLI